MLREALLGAAHPEPVEGRVSRGQPVLRQAQDERGSTRQDERGSTRASSPWIISRREDLIWFHGAALAGVALLAFFALGPKLTDATYSTAHPAVLALLLWGIFFDGTHVVGTHTHSRAAVAGRWAWILIGIGPAVAVIDSFALTPSASQLGNAGWLFRSFLLFAYLWAYFHLVRQHYGFVALYRRRANATDWIERRLETIVL